MRRAKLNFDGFHGANSPKLAAIVFALFVAACLSTPARAQQAGQKTFASAQEAANAVVAAAESNDEKKLLEILGPKGKRIVSSGDEAEDNESRATFVMRYREMHRLMKEPDGTTILYIGAHNWPAPIPLMNKGNVWYFDTEAGEKEILYRRIGRNEASAVRICQELVMAQKEYAGQHGGEYAQKIFSDEGQKNGLYWQAAVGEPQSPIGPLVASAVAEGYADGISALTPYRGYYFRILSLQGKHGPGGAKSYIIDGKMTEGFAFVAFPAQYRSSGVMTLIVGSDGVVYQKDLGKETSSLARHMKTYDPDATWHKAEEAQTSARDSETK